DRTQEQPLGILRRDPALRELDVDDRHLDVRLRLLGNGAIGDEALREQEEEQRNGQPRMADGIVNDTRHEPPSRSLRPELASSRPRPTPQPAWPRRADLR